MNLLDSSNWVEYFADGPNAAHFVPVIDDTGVLVPTIVLHEVFRWVVREGGDLAVERAVAAMQAGIPVPLDADLAIAAARLARRHKLPTVDSIIYATAKARRGIVWTQDKDFEDLPGVRYFSKAN